MNKLSKETVSQSFRHFNHWTRNKKNSFYKIIPNVAKKIGTFKELLTNGHNFKSLNFVVFVSFSHFYDFCVFILQHYFHSIILLLSSFIYFHLHSFHLFITSSLFFFYLFSTIFIIFIFQFIVISKKIFLLLYIFAVLY